MVNIPTTFAPFTKAGNENSGERVLRASLECYGDPTQRLRRGSTGFSLGSSAIPDSTSQVYDKSGEGEQRIPGFVRQVNQLRMGLEDAPREFRAEECTQQ